jgi:hypothetical protein
MIGISRISAALEGKIHRKTQLTGSGARRMLKVNWYQNRIQTMSAMSFLSGSLA